MLDYIETSETLFDKEIETFGDWIEKQQGEISDDNAEQFHDNCAARMRLLADDFPVLARHMAFCAIFRTLSFLSISSFMCAMQSKSLGSCLQMCVMKMTVVCKVLKPI
jgi:hypothetical protein